MYFISKKENNKIYILKEKKQLYKIPKIFNYNILKVNTNKLLLPKKFR